MAREGYVTGRAAKTTAQKRGKLMQAEQRGAFLSALFIDYDNVYFSLKRRSEDAAARFAQDPGHWLAQLRSGRLIRNEGAAHGGERRLAVNRLYGNPVPRRTTREGPNDPNSFIFVRHHFIRAGLEVVDCPPLTAQLKNGSDIRMALEVFEFIEHRTRFDEFILMSGDADFTPVLHRLREYDRRIVIYTNDHTAQPYTALCDGRIEEQDFVNFLLSNALPSPEVPSGSAVISRAGAETERAVGRAMHNALGFEDGDRVPAGAGYGQQRESKAAAPQRGPQARTDEPTIRALMDDFQEIGAEILDLVVKAVGEANKPVPIAYLANRAMKELGSEKTVGTNWAGSGGFLNFLSQNLPDRLRLTEAPPHCVYDPARHGAEQPREETQRESGLKHAAGQGQPLSPSGGNTRMSELQNSITRIHQASKAPPLPPSEYQLLFELIAAELHENGFHPRRTVSGVIARAEQSGVRLAEADVSFVIGAVDDADPWLENTRSPADIARTYRDVILSQCDKAGVQLSEDERQLVQVWFGAARWATDTGQGMRDSEHPGDGENRPASTQRPEIPLPPDFDDGAAGDDPPVEDRRSAGGSKYRR